MTTKTLSAWLLMLVSATVSGIAKEPAPAVAPAGMVFEDQFAKRRALDDLRGDVVVLVFSDREGAEASRELGAALHVLMHPQAAGQPPKVAAQAPARPLPNQQPGARVPDAKMIALACIGDVPKPIRPVVRSRFRSVSPDAVVWLDLNDTMRKLYQVKPSVPNLIVFDALGRERQRMAGKLDSQEIAQLAERLDALRSEGVSTRLR